MAQKKSYKNILACNWSKTIKDLNFVHPDADSAKALRYFFKIAHGKNGNLINELDKLGFDLTTFKFEIKKKKEE